MKGPTTGGTAHGRHKMNVSFLSPLPSQEIINTLKVQISHPQILLLTPSLSLVLSNKT